MNRFYSRITKLFHPFTTSLYACMLYLFVKGVVFSFQEQLYVWLQVVIITCLIPLLLLLFMRTIKVKIDFNSVTVVQKRVAVLTHCFLLILLVKRSIILSRYPELHFYFLGAIFSSIFILLLLFLKSRASLYMSSITGLTVFALGLTAHLKIGNPFIAAVLVCVTGIVAYSKLLYKRNTVKEIWLGTVIGCLPQIVFLYLWL